MTRRTTGGIVVLVGVAFIVTVLGTSLFGASRAADRINPDLATVMRAETLRQLRGDVQGLEAVATEFGTKVVPALAQALGVPPEQLASVFEGQSSALAAGVVALPQITTRLGQQIAVLEGQRENFTKADAIPTRTQSSTAVPAFILVTGILAIVAGLGMQRPTRALPALALALGGIMLCVPLVTSMTPKSAAADELNDAVKGFFTRQAVEQNTQAIQTIEAMAAEMQRSFLPGLGEQLKLTPAEAAAFVRGNLPAITTAQTQLPAALARFKATVAAVERHIDDYDQVRGVALRPINWTVIAGGVATMLAAAWALVTTETARQAAQARAERRERRAA